MEYAYLDYGQMKAYCEAIFRAYGFSAGESAEITDVIIDADLKGIESHGVQRLIRYDHKVTTGQINLHASPKTVYETPLSCVIDCDKCMGQLIAIRAMRLAIQKAKANGIGMVMLRNSSHYGIAGYYAEMAVREDLIGICMTNTEAIMIPTYGRQPMIGTNPIALGMPADPYPFLFDCATTVVARGKLEVYAKRETPLPSGWAVDENGRDCRDAKRVLKNINEKIGGGILPLGGFSEESGGHKGYGFGMICELFTGILAGGLTSDRINLPGEAEGTCESFIALDYGMFGDKARIRAGFSEYLQRIRASDKADGCERIYTHGEKEFLTRERRTHDGIPVNEKTICELKKIASKLKGFQTPFPETVKGDA